MLRVPTRMAPLTAAAPSSSSSTSLRPAAAEAPATALAAAAALVDDGFRCRCERLSCFAFDRVGLLQGCDGAADWLLVPSS